MAVAAGWTETDMLRVLRKVTAKYKTLTLSTQGPEGLWSGKVYFAVDGGAIYIALEQGKNFRNIRANPEVTFVIAGERPDQFIQGRGIAEILGPVEQCPERHILFRKVFEVVPFVKMIPGVMMVRITPTELYLSDFTGEWKPRARLNGTHTALVRQGLSTRISRAKVLFQAVRPFSFTVSVFAVLVGLLLSPAINWWLGALTLIGALLVHAGVNVLSDWFDWRRGADTWRVLGSSRVLVDGLLSPWMHFAWGAALIALAAGIGVYLAVETSPYLWWLIGAGAFFGLFYTMPPIGLKYRALGDLAVFLAFGPLMVLGAWLVQNPGATPWSSWLPPVLAGIPIGLLTIAILHGNNFRDIEEDRRAGYVTLAGLLGQKGSAWYYTLLVALAYLSVGIFIVLGWLPWQTALVALSLPLAIRNVRTAWNTRRVAFTMLDLLSAQLHMVFSLLYIVGLGLHRVM